MFTHVKLYTAEGGLAATVLMPEFETAPHVIVMGARTFVFVDSFVEMPANEGREEPNPEDEGCYVEALAWHAPYADVSTTENTGKLYRAADLMPLQETVKTVYSSEPMEDRVYVPFTNSRGCMCKIGEGYHWKNCPIAQAGIKAGHARPVYMKEEQHSPYERALRDSLDYAGDCPDQFGGSDY